ncbi:aminoglycoside phosphotransferase family protein [Paenibacillus apii]|uniref:aminoglycoside phosphotransferase family protein n=1 Tax=Paenibacillus apii TaxID=1850370 RepID=UPI002E2862CB|nr:aminoglycoside phosphotransferase family protein [Paenibacillus apii]
MAPLTRGMSTSNYVVQLEGNTKKYVLRIYPLNNDHSQLEIAAYNYARTMIRVPEIYFFDNSKQLIPNSYIIMEFIEGLTLGEFITENNGFPNSVVRSISGSLALLHQTEYTHMALLDENLRIKENFEPITSQYHTLFNGLAGIHIKPSTKEKFLHFINCNAELLKQVASKHVFSHGDFIFSNIIVTPSLQTCFIDYEYCFSAPVFYDIGKFFRTRTNVERYIGTETISAFFEGYNSKAKEPLPKEWYIYSKIADVATMLHLINKPNIPEGWGLAIDTEIEKTLDLLAY